MPRVFFIRIASPDSWPRNVFVIAAAQIDDTPAVYAPGREDSMKIVSGFSWVCTLAQRRGMLRNATET